MSLRNSLDNSLLNKPDLTSNVLTNSAGLSKKRKGGVDVKRQDANGLKKTKFEQKPARKNDEEDGLDLSLCINKAFARMDSHLLADYMSNLTRKFESALSSIELEDRYIPATAITDTTPWVNSRSLVDLPIFLETFSTNPAKLWSASKKNGAPHTIVVTGAGLRAADIARVLRKYQTKDASVAKLFAKHIKIKDAIGFLQNTRTGMAVGTPKRLDDLMDEGALVVDKLERIVVDASHIDQKKRGILEMRETQIPLTSWLNRRELRGRLGQNINGIDLIFY